MFSTSVGDAIVASKGVKFAALDSGVICSTIMGSNDYGSRSVDSNCMASDCVGLSCMSLGSSYRGCIEFSSSVYTCVGYVCIYGL